MQFQNRTEAADLLSERLLVYQSKNPLVLALPRGGVPIGYRIAEKLNARLEVIVSRKIGAPTHEEFGIGAVSENNSIVLDQPTIELLSINNFQLKKIIDREKDELKRKVDLYRQGKPLPHLKNFTVILVDDGLATGVTAKAAIDSVKKLQPKSLIFAAPTCAYDTSQELAVSVDSLICLMTPRDFMAVGLWYREFEQLTDEDVVNYLHHSRQLTAS